VLRVGLTGGIGSGKTEVSRWLAAYGAVVVDADVLAREVVAAGTEGFEEVVRAFGDAVVAADGELDRAQLGRRVFDDDEARRRLERVIHPRVRARAHELEQQAPPGSVVVHDIPLLVETGQAYDFDVVVVVDAPDEVRLDRLTRTRGMDRAEASHRIEAQADRGERLAAADEVVDNSGGLAALGTQVDLLWRRLETAAHGAG